MNRDGCHFIQGLCKPLWAAGVVALLTAPAFADLTNKYTFNDNTANDSVGFDDGTVVDNTEISLFVAGAIDLSANNGASSNQDFSIAMTRGAYVDLPNGVFTRAASAGVFGAVTLEVWATPQQNFNWARLADFGTSNMGENFSTGGGDASYVIIVPQNGIGGVNNNQVTASTHHQNVTEPDEVFLFGGPGLTPGVKHHVVFTLDQNDTTGGPNGTAKLYVDNGAPVTAAIVPNIILDSITDNNNWLGRAQWPDPLFDGAIDEFRIYSHALSASEVIDSFTVGPEPSPSPTLLVDRDTGMISLANETANPFALKGYSISSAAGGLNPASWVSIDADNTFDPNGNWTAQSSTSTSLAESVTGGTLDGGTLANGTSRGIGMPWRQTPFEDLVFNYTLGDGSNGLGLVKFSGTPLERSDFDADGDLTIEDWEIFLSGAYTNISGETTVGAYLKGDLDGDKDNDYADFLFFKADFIAANGAPAFAALTGQVPEPSSLVLAALALAMIGTGFRRTA